MDEGIGYSSTCIGSAEVVVIQLLTCRAAGSIGIIFKSVVYR